MHQRFALNLVRNSVHVLALLLHLLQLFALVPRMHAHTPALAWQVLHSLQSVPSLHHLACLSIIRSVPPCMFSVCNRGGHGMLFALWHRKGLVAASCVKVSNLVHMALLFYDSVEDK